nr:hypothetical protein [Brachybacterium epidermidis]
MHGTDGLAAHPQDPHGDRERQDDGAQVADLLQQQGGPGLDHQLDAGADVRTEAGDERHQRHHDQRPGSSGPLPGDHLLHVPRDVGVQQQGDHEGVQHRQQQHGADTDGDAAHPDQLGQDADDQHQQVQRPEPGETAGGLHGGAPRGRAPGGQVILDATRPFLRQGYPGA